MKKQNDANVQMIQLIVQCIKMHKYFYENDIAVEFAFPDILRSIKYSNRDKEIKINIVSNVAIHDLKNKQ